MSEMLENVVKMINQFVPFHAFLKIEVTEMRKGFVRMEAPFREEYIGDPRRPALHGGLISTLADSSGGGAVWSKLDDANDRVSTVDLRMDYLRPGPPEDIVCEATVVRIGNMVGVAEMKVFAVSDPERIIATGKGVYNIHHPR